MNKKRIAIFLFSICSFFVCFTQSYRDVRFDVKKVSPRVVVFQEESPMQNNIVVIATQKGLVVIDTSGSTVTVKRVKQLAGEMFQRNDFNYVINTHYHWDHTRGNQVFPGATIIGHQNCVEAMRRSAARIPAQVERNKTRLAEEEIKLKKMDPQSKETQEMKKRHLFNKRIYMGAKENFTCTPPTLTFKDRMSLNLGDITLELYYFGRAHSTSDIFIFIPEEGLLFTGDLFLDEGWLPLFAGQPVLDIPRWIKVMNHVLAPEQNLKMVLPGHKSFWTREKFSLWRDYITNLWAGIQQADKDGLDIEAVKKRFPLGDKFMYLKELRHTDERLQRYQERNITAFWRQLKKNPVTLLEKLINSEGIDGALKKYQEIKSNTKEYFFDEAAFNALGYRLMGENKLNEAITVFKWNVETYPGSWNVYDSLAEAYMNQNNKKLSIKYYKKSIKLNPENTNGKEMIKRMKQKK